MDKLIIATNNKHKLKELREVLHPYFESILSLEEAGIQHETVEDAATFEGNALKKAREIACISGCAALADDSGLSVKALNGEPGVYSARYAGEPCNDRKNLELVLEKMEGIKDRTACFVCVLALVTPSGELTARGEVAGELTYAPQGEGGFGYDPIFYIPQYKCTFAQMTQEQKNQLSHRAIAARLLAGKCARL
ncbi:MAG: RdgB/HAM1 family non-canonical purine NTP pyrophosphatase [Christensenellaceae bacterium]|jgi:non-canonical purine NTP pyrophosphatase, rdgB/HAM1 family|nr:RdgB/HAM1 family non-canonical purine NTP pyrophosphatase [Christensenellaceae bacterium]MBS6564571.1 RdgB/HAM1 family non-canonical purine NTP pyrophosphatase [Clostridiales bacterium]PWL99081.1 MAG: non-canonical purine NTP pyrophosphatase, RdgB/HAM1 family [Selenomonadales bacterium]